MQALSLICNAVLRERRIVHLDDMDNWLMHYNRCGSFTLNYENFEDRLTGYHRNL